MPQEIPPRPPRRRFVAASLLAAALPWRPARAAARPRILIVGGGWGGLSAARHLRSAAPDADIVLFERQAEFRSLPLSNPWLAGRPGARLFTADYAAAARRFGYTFVRAEVSAIDRERRQVDSSAGRFAYDWLVLACGIRHDYAAWFGADREAAAHARRHYPPAFTVGDELAALRAKLENFAGGDLLMNIPAGPQRCPPAPYERALHIGWLLKTRRIKGRLLLLDPGAGLLGFPRVFAEQYREQIVHLPHTPVRGVDPYRKVVASDVEDFSFADAILMPPQQAGDLAWQAGVATADGWAGQHPTRLQALADERLFVVGDAVGKVSPLFGQYPKSGHVAARLGRIAALAIAAGIAGREAETLLPDGLCHVATSIEPPESLRVEAGYRLRGDGLLMQSVRQQHDPQPRGEDAAWAAGHYREMLGAG